MEFAHKNGYDSHTNDIIFEVSSSASRPIHLAILRKTSPDSVLERRALAVMKGHPDDLLQLCNSIQTNDGIKEPLNEEIFDAFEVTSNNIHKYLYFQANYSKLTADGNILIGFASMELDYAEEANIDEQYGKLLETKRWGFLGMAAIVEPLLPGVEAAVKRAEQARIRIFLVTNDHATNAEFLARQVGFYNQNSLSSSSALFGSTESLNTSSASYTTSEKSSGSLSIPIIVHGENLSKMTSQDWANVLKHRHVIFARTTAAQKLELIKQCHRQNYVVALTGNELADAKSLKA